jgi:hypothetical protein
MAAAAQPKGGGYPISQADALDALAKEVGKTPAAFREVQKNTEIRQRRVNEMLAETVRQINKVRNHTEQKVKHVTETTKSFSAKFDTELLRLSEGLKQEAAEAVVKMEEVLDGLDKTMTEAEAALVRQREERKRHIEENLGPIRDEAARILHALEAERKDRKRMEEDFETFLVDEVESINKLIGEEKFSREQQLKEFVGSIEVGQQRIEKRQLLVINEIRTTVEQTRVEHQTMVKDRKKSQDSIVESIASFVSRCQEQAEKESSLQQGIQRLASPK